MKPMTVAIALAGALALAACSSSNRRKADARQAATRAAAAEQRGPTGTSDPGSRYLDTAGPVGGIAVETAPIPDGANMPYYPEPAGPDARQGDDPYPGTQYPGTPLPAAAPDPRAPAQPGVLPPPKLPAPAQPPREQLPPPPTGGWR